MQTTITNQQKAQTEAALRAANALAEIDLSARCATLHLPAPASDGSITLRLFGQDLRLTPPDFSAVIISSEKPAKLADRILALHYLLSPAPIEPRNQWISFRDFPGGQFYWGPFCSRTAKPLTQRIGNNLDQLRKNLDRFDWQPLEMPDLSAKIQAVGSIDAALIYRQGDDEMEPTAEILFDASAKRVFCAEDASVIASRICLGLL